MNENDESKAPGGLVIGAGAGLSASLARRLVADGMRVGLAARDTAKLAALAEETGARCYACDVAEPLAVERLFEQFEADLGIPEVVVFNPSRRVRGPVADLDPEEVRQALLVTCFGGFLVGSAAARLMQRRGSGSILFTGASASVKGYPLSAPFAMGKFGLRGLVQSMARELAPAGIHVAHFIIDGGIGRSEAQDRLDPDDIADAYLQIHHQARSAWTWEVELRPWMERF